MIKKKNRNELRICTWNLLVPLYCNSKHYVSCTLNDIDPKKRFNRILTKLKEQIQNKNTIIVLQEVSRKWGNKLKIWFKNRKYNFEQDHYGNKYSDFMGVAIAYPINLKLEKYYSKVIGAQLDLKPIEESYIYQLYYWIKDKFGYRINSYNDDINNAIRRKNVLLGIKLNLEGKSVWILTYHMPCAFSKQNVMNWHAQECLRQIEELKKECPVILGGDFNSKPGSSVHKMFTSGSMQSAYLESDGKEPKATNFVETRRGYQFKACLDFIFYTKNQLKLKSTMILENLDKIMPNIEEPSDHLMIGATFALT